MGDRSTLVQPMFAPRLAPDGDKTPRVVTIVATSEDSASNCIAWIIDTVNRVVTRAQTGAHCQQRIIVGRYGGAVKGRHGSTVQRMQDITGTHIVVVKTPLVDDTEVLIEGKLGLYNSSLKYERVSEYLVL